MSDEESEKQRGQRTSDVPVDLTRERETFVRQFLRKGVELTETVLEENKTLHDKLNAAQREIAMLRAQVASDDAIRDLIKKIESLETERNKLLEKSTELEETTRQKETRNVEVEQELHDLANLYIASSHLHSTLSVRGVVKHLKELLQQLVGADIYAIYLMDGDGDVAHPLACDGIELSALSPVTKGEGMVGEVLMTGIAKVSERWEQGGTLEEPLAAIPIMVRDQAVGAIAVATVFEQKEQWAAVDHELFKLLGSHAATALIAANLYADADGALVALSGVAGHLTQPSTSPS